MRRIRRLLARFACVLRSLPACLERCVRIGFKVPGAALKLKAGKGTKAVSLTPGATKNVKVACPAGQAPTGAGFAAVGS